MYGLKPEKRYAQKLTRGSQEFLWDRWLDNLLGLETPVYALQAENLTTGEKTTWTTDAKIVPGKRVIMMGLELVDPRRLALHINKIKYGEPQASKDLEDKLAQLLEPQAK